MKTTYPTWVKEILTPELEEKKPIKDGTLIWHTKQKNGGLITGQEIYDWLKETDQLKYCVSLKTLQYYEKNPDKIPAEWKGKFIYGWKSVVRDGGGYLGVPYLRCLVGAPYVGWCSLGRQWRDREPALREQVSSQNSDTYSSLSLNTLPSELEKAIALCKENGLTVTKTY